MATSTKWLARGREGFIVTAWLLVALNAPAASRTWDGGGTNGFWTTPANWVGDVAPNPGDSLTFPAAAARMVNTNNFS